MKLVYNDKQIAYSLKKQDNRLVVISNIEIMVDFNKNIVIGYNKEYELNK